MTVRFFIPNERWCLLKELQLVVPAMDRGDGEPSLHMLIDRSAELKRDLVRFARGPRFERLLTSAMLAAAGPDRELDEVEAIRVIDRFALQHRLPDGKTVVDRFLATRPDLTATDQEMLLGWRDPVEGIFEIGGEDGDAIMLLNLLDDLEYRTYSNMGRDAFRSLPEGGFLYARMVPIGPVRGTWLVSGSMSSFGKSDATSVARLALELAARRPEWVFRNPEKVKQGWAQMRADRAAFVELGLVLPARAPPGRLGDRRPPQRARRPRLVLSDQEERPLFSPSGRAECRYYLAWWRTWQKEGTMGVMTAPDFWSGQDRMLTVEDMENMPDDEFRYELDDGLLIVSPAPSTLHQLAVTRLAVILSAACPAEFVVLAGVGVNINKFQHRVPDVAVVRAGSVESFFQEAPPELVVEVASPRTRLYDRNRKKDLYEGFGVAAYWIIEPHRDRPELTVFELRSRAFEQTAHVSGDEEYHAVVPFPVTVVPSKLVTVS